MPINPELFFQEQDERQRKEVEEQGWRETNLARRQRLCDAAGDIDEAIQNLQSEEAARPYLTPAKRDRIADALVSFAKALKPEGADANLEWFDEIADANLPDDAANRRMAIHLYRLAIEGKRTAIIRDLERMSPRTYWRVLSQVRELRGLLIENDPAKAHERAESYRRIKAERLAKSEAEALKADERGRKSVKPATVNMRMLDTITKRSESRGWSARQWAENLKCSPSTVHNTIAWKNLQDTREEGIRERLPPNRGRRVTKKPSK